MFNKLTENLTDAIRNIMGQGRVTEKNIKDALRRVREALLDADVALPVVKRFIDHVRSQAMGKVVESRSIRPGDAFIKIFHEQLVQILGDNQAPLNLQAQPPVVILVAGLQGSGKTTTSAKLAHWLIHRQRKSVMLTSADIYRPAAIKQLETLAEQVGAKYHPTTSTQHPVAIAREALSEAKKAFVDVVIIDTAGRLHIDEAMMEEIKQIHQAIQPTETLFVVDSMTGQDAANTAKAFNDALPLTGVILTKTDGDARGGAALSIRLITDKPIKFIGVGEKVDALEPFYPDRIASRILGMGDIVSLVEEAQQKIDKEKAQALAKKITKGQGFDLEDFLGQLKEMRKLGGLSQLLGKIPGMQQITASAKDAVNDKILGQMEAIICSMTPKERQNPVVIRGSHKRRIAEGSGTQIQDVSKVLKQYDQMQKMMKKMKGGGFSKMMRNLRGMGSSGNFPPAA